MNKEKETPEWCIPVTLLLIVIVSVLVIRREVLQNRRIQALRMDVKYARYVADQARERADKLFDAVYPEKCVAIGPGWGIECMPRSKPAWKR